MRASRQTRTDFAESCLTIYKGYALYLPKEEELERDKAGRYLVHVTLGKAGTDDIVVIPIPGCVAESSEEAAILSVEQAMRLIDEGFLIMAVAFAASRHVSGQISS